MSTLGELTDYVLDMYELTYAGLDRRIKSLANKYSEIIASEIPRLWLLETAATWTTTSGTSVYDLPKDLNFIKEVYMIESSNTRLLVQTGKFDTLYHDPRHRDTGRTGKPATYVLWRDKIEVDPIPDAAYDMEIIYFAKPKKLTATDSTSVLLQESAGYETVASGILADLHKKDGDFELAQIRHMEVMDGIQRLRSMNFQKRGHKNWVVKTGERGRGASRRRLHNPIERSGF